MKKLKWAGLLTMLVSASNFVLLYVFWELVGLCSYLLIGFWYEKPASAAAGKPVPAGRARGFACNQFEGGTITATVVELSLRKEKGGILGDAIKWNFTKFLVNRSGEVVGRYASTVVPADIEADIRALL